MIIFFDIYLPQGLNTHLSSRIVLIVASHRTFTLDLHIHTALYSPCSRILPEEVIPTAKARGLDGVALTEHGHCWTPQEIARLKETAGDDTLVVLAGCEVQTSREGALTGDLLVFGVAQAPREPCTIDEVCQQAHRQGGIVIAPHPFAGLAGIRDELYQAPIDAIEVYNQRYRAPQATRLAREAWKMSGLAGVASSDAHHPECIGQYCTRFDMPIRCAADLIEAILQRRARPLQRAPRRWLWGLF